MPVYIVGVSVKLTNNFEKSDTLTKPIASDGGQVTCEPIIRI